MPRYFASSSFSRAYTGSAPQPRAQTNLLTGRYPHRTELAEDHLSAKFLKVDVDENADLTQELGISAMPTFHFISTGGNLVDTIVGADPIKLAKYVELHSKA